MDGSRPDDERIAHGADAVRDGAYVRAGWILAIAIILSDQATKWWILEIVMQPPQVVEVLPFFNLVLTWNTGVSFGLFAGASGWQPFFLSALAVGVCIALAIWLKRADGKWLAWGLGLIIGGALGNVIDRLRIGAVTDFLDVHVAGYHWPAFNVADAAITTGAAILILDSLFRKDKSS